MQILVDGIGRPLVPLRPRLLLVGGQDVHPAEGAVQIPGLPVADVVVQDQRLVLGQHPHRVDVRVDAVGQRKVDDAVLGPEGDGGFGDLAGQRVEPASLPSGQQHGDHFFGSHHNVPFPVLIRLPAQRP